MRERERVHLKDTTARKRERESSPKTRPENTCNDVVCSLALIKPNNLKLIERLITAFAVGSG